MFKSISSFGALLVALILLAFASITPSFADQPFELRSDGFRSGMVSFNANATGYAAYATPTDMVGICGSATRVVVVTSAYIDIGTTSAALQTIYFIKRSTADAGGTSTAVTPTAYDSTDRLLPTATVMKYSVIPTTLGTTDGILKIAQVTSSVLTAPYADASLFGTPGATADLIRFTRPLVLRGTGDCLYINYNGAALTGGFASKFSFDWAEQ